MSSPTSEYATQFVSASAIAARYHVTPRYVLLLAAAGKIPSLRLGRRCVRFNESAVAKALGLKAKDFDATPSDGEGAPSGRP